MIGLELDNVRLFLNANTCAKNRSCKHICFVAVA